MNQTYSEAFLNYCGVFNLNIKFNPIFCPSWETFLIYLLGPLLCSQLILCLNLDISAFYENYSFAPVVHKSSQKREGISTTDV